MSPRQTPDNTSSALTVIALIAIGLILAAALIGLSEKPELTAIAISASDGSTSTVAPPLSNSAGASSGDQDAATSSDDDTRADQVSGSATTDDAPQVAAIDDAGDDGAVDELGNSIQDAGDEAAGSTDTGTTAGPTAENPADAGTESDDDGHGAEAGATVATSATPEVAAAVEPTPIPDETTDVDDDLGALADTPATTIKPGTVVGSFFTRADEDDGATITRNELSLTLAEDGTGSFAGVLDMALIDETHIMFQMAGAILWSGDSPQVSAELNGSYMLDSPIDAEDVMSSTGELTITSLGSGSGSLCTPRCFGFTFPPVTGL